MQVERLEDRLVLSTVTFNLPAGPAGNDVTLQKSGDFVTLTDDNSGQLLIRYFAGNVQEFSLRGQPSDAENLTIDFASAGYFNERIRFATNFVGNDSVRILGDGQSANVNTNSSAIGIQNGANTSFISWGRLDSLEVDGFQRVVLNEGSNGALNFLQSSKSQRGIEFSAPSFVDPTITVSNTGTLRANLRATISNQVNIGRMNATVNRFEIFGSNGNDSFNVTVGNFNSNMVNINAGSGSDILRLDVSSDLRIRSAQALNKTFTISSPSRQRMVGSNFESIDVQDSDVGHWLNASTSPVPVNIDGNGGDDRILGSRFNDVISGGSGRDDIRGGIGNDQIFGDAGGDWLFGQQGRDVIEGGIGNDQLFGGIANDILRGGAGNDRLNGGIGNDILIGNGGVDTLMYTGTDASDRITLRFDPAQNEAIVLRRGGVSSRVLNRDRFRLDSQDRFEMESLAGNDIFDIDFTRVSGTIDGGDGNDRCSVPNGWTVFNCES